MILAWLRLLRLPNLPSAATNVIAGAALAGALGGAVVDAATLSWACLSSVAVYACGLIWNDLADEECDRSARPERPLPRGEISRRAAWSCSAVLLGLAALGAANLPSSSWKSLALIAALAFLYDFALKASPLLGPLALGLCRALNLALGMTLSSGVSLDGESSGILSLVVIHYFLYIAILSSFARMEDSAVDKRRARLELFAIALVVISLGIRLAASVDLLQDAVRGIALVAPLLALACFALVRSLTWQSLDPARARHTVIWLLGGICLLDAALAAFAWSLWGLLLLVPAAMGPMLRKKISAS